MSEFKVGDVVKLKCNPQEMAVQATGATNLIVCVWIEDYGVPHKEEYVSQVLELVDSGDPLTSPPSALKRKKAKDTLFREDDSELQGD